MPPPVNRVIETVIYCPDLDAAEEFYGGILGLRKGARFGDRGVSYVVANDMLLIFNADETAKGGTVPPHGTRGPGHFALQIEPDEYSPWLEHLKSHGWRSCRSITGLNGMPVRFTFTIPPAMSPN